MNKIESLIRLIISEYHSMKLTENTIDDDVKNATVKFGWKAIKTNTGFELFNRLNKKVTTIELKKDKYTFFDSIGNKLMSGKGQIGTSIEKLLKNYYYAKEN